MTIRARRATTILTRMLDRAERLIWESQDARLRAAGWEVIRRGRWRREYRRPPTLLRLSASRQGTAPSRHRNPPQNWRERRPTDHRQLPAREFR